MAPLIGIDIGKKNDPTALCVAERQVRASNLHFSIRHLERLPLRMPYPDIADRLQEVIAGVFEIAQKRPVVYIDATGVGAPVVDSLRDKASSISVIWAVSFVAGARQKFNRMEQTVSVGKTFLVRRLQALLQRECVHLPKGVEGRVLADELLNYEMRIDQNAHEKYGAFRAGAHDDLATALALAVLPAWEL